MTLKSKYLDQNRTEKFKQSKITKTGNEWIFKHRHPRIVNY